MSTQKIFPIIQPENKESFNDTIICASIFKLCVADTLQGNKRQCTELFKQCLQWANNEDKKKINETSSETFF